jgi:hypothetical protein
MLSFGTLTCRVAARRHCLVPGMGRPSRYNPGQPDVPTDSVQVHVDTIEIPEAVRLLVKWV